MMPTFVRTVVLPAAFLAVALVVSSCGDAADTESRQGARASSPAGGDTARGAPPLPTERLQALTDDLPARTGVPGAVVGVSRRGERWIGAAGIDDVATGAPMTADRRFRVASNTKLFTAAVVMGLVEDGELSLDDRLSRWFPAFPNADAITIEMLLTHTAGVTSVWWENPEIVQLALDDLGRVWSPQEVVERLATQPPAGPPGGASSYSNLGYILLGEIVADVADAPLGDVIHERVIERLGLAHTTFQFDNPPNLAHGYYDFQGQTLDTSVTPGQALLSMGGAGAAVHSDAADLLEFHDRLFQTDDLLEPETVASMQSTSLTGNRWGVTLMGFCPCTGTGAATKYRGWGHTGKIPGYFTASVHFPDDELSVVVFLNRDIVDGVDFNHDALDPVVEEIARLIDEATT